MAHATHINNADVNEETRTFTRRMASTITEDEIALLTRRLSNLPKDVQLKLCDGDMSKVAKSISDGIIGYTWDKSEVTFLVLETVIMVMYFKTTSFIPDAHIRIPRPKKENDALLL